MFFILNDYDLLSDFVYIGQNGDCVIWYYIYSSKIKEKKAKNLVITELNEFRIKNIPVLWVTWTTL